MAKLKKKEKARKAELRLRLMDLIEKTKRGDLIAEKLLLKICEDDKESKLLAEKLLRDLTKESNNYAHSRFCVRIPGGWWPIKK